MEHGTIKYEDYMFGKQEMHARYYDKYGNELKNNDRIRWNSGKEEKIYMTSDGYIGTDATNPHWIESGRASECEYGIYPLTELDMKEIEKII